MLVLYVASKYVRQTCIGEVNICTVLFSGNSTNSPVVVSPAYVLGSFLDSGQKTQLPPPLRNFIELPDYMVEYPRR
jgi:hypothetical protein